MRGYTKREMRRDKTEGPDLLFHHNAIAKISRSARKDKAEQKRVELHVHTQMSSMDAVIPPSDLVKQANKWGHKAIAITDHGNVQAYQDAMLTAEKIGQKVIWGMEAYFVVRTLFDGLQPLEEGDLAGIGVVAQGIGGRPLLADNGGAGSAAAGESWLIKIMVIPFSFSSFNVSCKAITFSASTPTVGSSRINNLGDDNKARAMKTR